MPDPTTPAVPGEAVPATTAPAPAPDPLANAAFAEMRTKLATAEREKTELAERLTALERKDMDEKQRTSAELEDAKKIVQELSPIKDAHAKIVLGVETACANAIQALPEDKRATIDLLTKHVPLEDRMQAIQQAAAAFGPAPITAGTPTAPGGAPNSGLPGAALAAKPLDVKDLGRLSWADAAKSLGPPQSSSNTEYDKRLEALEKQLAAK